MLKFLKSFYYAFRGLKIAWKEESNFGIQVLIALIVIALLIFFHFSYIESAIIIFAIILVLMAEIINTALENLCNKIEPNHDTIIGKIKDMAATFVLIASVGALITGIIIFSHHFISD